MKLRFVLVFVCFSLFGFSQTKETALRDAKIAAAATLNEDYELLLKHTFPEVVGVMGGSENAIQTIKTAMEGMKAQGFVFEKAEVVSVSDILKEDEQYRCYVENNNVMKMNDMRIRSKSYLLGVYDNVKAIWYFIEAEKLKNKEMVEKILPGFKTSLQIPDDEMKMEKIE